MNEINEKNGTSYYNHIGVDNLLHVLRYCHPINEFLHFTTLCRGSHCLSISDEMAPQWQKIALHARLSSICKCGMQRSHKSIIWKLILSRNFKTIRLCIHITLLNDCFRAIGAKNSATRISFLISMIIPGYTFNIDEALQPSNFSKLKEILFYSTNMHEMSNVSLHRLFRIIGGQLDTVVFLLSCPSDITGILCKHCPMLRRMRGDSKACMHTREDSVFPLLEELVAYNKLRCECDLTVRRESLYFPSLRRFSLLGKSECDEYLLRTIHRYAPNVTQLELGDASQCASSATICGIAQLYPDLQSLTLVSEDEAQLISADTVLALRRGCGGLVNLDLRSALVVFGEGALEAICGWPSLQSFALAYSRSVVLRLQSVLGDCPGLRLLTFSDRDLEAEDGVEAQEEVHALDSAFPLITCAFEGRSASGGGEGEGPFESPRSWERL